LSKNRCHLSCWGLREPYNVGGTLNVIKFASTKRQKFINFISTASVFSDLDCQKSIITEQSILNSKNFQTLGAYNQTKWVSEKLMSEAKSRGFPVNIFRPGLISWSYRLGTFNTKDWFSSLILGILLVGHYPKSHACLNLVTVDYVSAAIVALALKSTHVYSKNVEFGNIYHLIASEIVHFGLFFDLINQIEIIPETTGKKKLWKFHIMFGTELLKKNYPRLSLLIPLLFHCYLRFCFTPMEFQMTEILKFPIN